MRAERNVRRGQRRGEGRRGRGGSATEGSRGLAEDWGARCHDGMQVSQRVVGDVHWGLAGHGELVVVVLIEAFMRREVLSKDDAGILLEPAQSFLSKNFGNFWMHGFQVAERRLKHVERGPRSTQDFVDEALQQNCIRTTGARLRTRRLAIMRRRRVVVQLGGTGDGSCVLR